MQGIEGVGGRISGEVLCCKGLYRTLLQSYGCMTWLPYEALRLCENELSHVIVLVDFCYAYKPATSVGTALVLETYPQTLDSSFHCHQLAG